MTFTANFMGQSSPFPCIPMEKVILSYTNAIEEGIILSMVNVDLSKEHLMYTIHLTLVRLSRSQQPFLIWLEQSHKSFKSKLNSFCLFVIFSLNYNSKYCKKSKGHTNLILISILGQLLQKQKYKKIFLTHVGFDPATFVSLSIYSVTWATGESCR